MIYDALICINDHVGEVEYPGVIVDAEEFYMGAAVGIIDVAGPYLHVASADQVVARLSLQVGGGASFGVPTAGDSPSGVGVPVLVMVRVLSRRVEVCSTSSSRVVMVS